MSQANLHPMLNIAVKAARAAGSIINRASLDLERLTVTSKGSNDFVTEVDQAAEQAIIDTLLQAYPGHGILAEESGREQGSRNSDFVWIIDPLDGTTNFIHGLPQYAVSIALEHRGKIEQAVVYDPARNDLFYATKGRGAFMNDRRLRVSKRNRMLEALIGTGFPFRRGDNFKRYLKMFEEVMQACAGVRRPGAAALDLCYVAAGWYDGFFETGLSPWDVAAGSLIVTEAGGLVGNFTGESDFLHQRELLAGNPKIYAQLVQMLAPYSRVIAADEAAEGTATAAAAHAAADVVAAALADAAAAPAAKKAVRVKKADASAAPAAATPVATSAPAPAPEEASDVAPADTNPAEPATPAIDIPMTPAQALAAAFDPTPPSDDIPAPVVVRKPVRIRKADLPAAQAAPEEATAPRADEPRARPERTERAPRSDRPARTDDRERAPRGGSAAAYGKPARTGGRSDFQGGDRPAPRGGDRPAPRGDRPAGKPFGKPAGGGFGDRRPAGSGSASRPGAKNSGPARGGKPGGGKPGGGNRGPGGSR